MRYERALELSEQFENVIKRQYVGNYVLLDYYYADWAMFRDFPETREFRGIVYDTRTGEIASRPMHKFFNINQVEETTGLMISGKLSEKRDGSMVQATYHGEDLIVASRSSLSGYVHDEASPLFTNEIKDFMRGFPNLTFLFEFEDVNHSIVLKHKKTQLVYLMARDKETGEYSFDINVPGVESVEYLHVDPSLWPLYQNNAEESKMEGWVVWVDGYGPVKWKTPWYVESHGIVTEHNPRKWVEFWANDDVDDALSVLGGLGHDERVKELEDFASLLNRELFDTINRAYGLSDGAETIKDCAIATQEIRDEPFGPLVFSYIMKSARNEGLPLKRNAPELMTLVKENIDSNKASKLAKAYFAWEEDEDV